MTRHLYLKAIAAAYLLFSALLAAGCSASSTSPPPATTGPGVFMINVRVTNRSDTCAWTTIYFATFYKPWIIANNPYNRPRFVYPNEFYDFTAIPVEQLIPPATIPGEIKVRAEFMKNRDCSGGMVADTSAENKSILPDSGTAGLVAQVYSTLSGFQGKNYSVSTPSKSQTP